MKNYLDFEEGNVEDVELAEIDGIRVLQGEIVQTALTSQSLLKGIIQRFQAEGHNMPSVSEIEVLLNDLLQGVNYIESQLPRLRMQLNVKKTSELLDIYDSLIRVHQQWSIFRDFVMDQYFIVYDIGELPEEKLKENPLGKLILQVGKKLMDIIAADDGIM